MIGKAHIGRRTLDGKTDRSRSSIHRRSITGACDPIARSGGATIMRARAGWPGTLMARSSPTSSVSFLAPTASPAVAAVFWIRRIAIPAPLILPRRPAWPRALIANEIRPYLGDCSPKGGFFAEAKHTGALFTARPRDPSRRL